MSEHQREPIRVSGPYGLQNPALRRRAHAGLNKGELRNTLAKALRFYRRGAVADRDREEQQRKASGLNLTIAAISLWNTVYLQKAIRAKVEAGEPVPEHVLPHLAPLGWEHITLTGTYHWRRYRSNFQTLRPLRTRKVPSKTSHPREEPTSRTGSQS